MARCKQTARQSTGGKAPDTSLPPRLLEEWPLHRGLKSLIVIVLALLRREIRRYQKAQIFLSARCHSSALQGKFCRI
eukprot:CCRYP_008806-RA/>CCRYP_008806-RA protein AED:0.22 eAED:0.22 QI:0/-1/0/1/-1/0/1/0/76